MACQCWSTSQLEAVCTMSVIHLFFGACFLHTSLCIPHILQKDDQKKKLGSLLHKSFIVKYLVKTDTAGSFFWNLLHGDICGLESCTWATLQLLLSHLGLFSNTCYVSILQCFPNIFCSAPLCRKHKCQAPHRLPHSQLFLILKMIVLYFI